MKLNNYYIVYLLLFSLLVIENGALANSDNYNNLVDPMLPKLLNDEKIKGEGDKYESNAVKKVKQFNLSAIGYNDDTIYCIVNGDILSINGVIDGYKIQDIQEDTIILINDSGESKSVKVNY